MTSTDALILDLSADLAPVQRRSMRREAGVLLALGAAELALLLLLVGMRPDMGRIVLLPYMIWKIGSLALLAGVTCTVAIRSFTPPAPSRRQLALAIVLCALAAAGGLLVTSATEQARPLVERLEPAHGMMCALMIIVLALPMMAVLGMLMRRAAPIHPGRSALATGLAASTCGALLFSLCCPMNDPLYIVIWYSAAVATVTAAARWILPRRFRL